ncbi:putative disease resistance protein RGA1 [Hordeum vulgare]|nr:putative disease resistance protein RGA1 [Hordeum vulgare]
MVGVGEMIASAVVMQVTSRLVKIAGDEIALHWKFKGEVDKMVEKMKDLEAVMHDADNKVSQGGDVGAEVGRWLVKLKSVAYDVEDLLDDLDTKNNEAKLKVFFSRDNQAYQWIARPHNLVDVRKRIEEIETERKPFKLVPEAQVERSRKKETFATISDRGTSTGMQGRMTEKEILVNLILRSQATEHISIIPIVGLGGIGKTTLAQSVYADKRVDIFDIRAWVHVSEKFDLLKIMKAIIKSLDANINLDNVGLQFLQDSLQVKLAGKKYLLVLDDFWEEGGDNLEELKRMLQHGSSGSRIIVTTRNQLVVEQMKTGILAHQRVILPVHESDQINLGFLPTNDCWELIKIRAFRPDHDQTHLEQIGYEIASKCGGIPLVANAFGQVMSEDRSIKAWQDIKVKLVDVGFRGTCQNGTLDSLRLSYYYMKREFKICFAYLAAFPKGFLIDTNRLIQQWYALGYIYSEHNGESCINYLLGMSFLQISGHPKVNQGPVYGNASRELTMHDLVHDLASIIIGDEFLVLDPEANGPRNWKKAIHCRHADMIHYQNQSNVFNCLPKKLRSLHIRDSLKWQLPPKAFSQSKYMRVLDLACSARARQPSEGQSTSSKIMLPRSIKKLKLLRYLDATGLPIPSLSKSVHTFQNMETLIMSNCSLETLPDNICSLHKLRYLDLSGNRSLDKLPTQLERRRLQGGCGQYEDRLRRRRRQPASFRVVRYPPCAGAHREGRPIALFPGGYPALLATYAAAGVQREGHPCCIALCPGGHPALAFAAAGAHRAGRRCIVLFPGGYPAILAAFAVAPGGLRCPGQESIPVSPQCRICEALPCPGCRWGGGLGEIGSQVKISGDAHDQLVDIDSPSSSDDPGDQQDDAGAKRPYTLLSVDPGVQGGGGEVPVVDKTFAKPRQTSRDTKVCTHSSRGCSAGVHRIWEVSFWISKDASKVEQRGSLVVHLSSGWATIRDDEGDILAGSYLMYQDLRIGLQLEMDGLLVLLINPDHFGGDFEVKKASAPPRVGGKFWVLADYNSDTDIEEEISPSSPVPFPSPDGRSPDGISVECKIERDFHLPRKKMDVPRPKPWIGPLPKVSRSPILLSDFLVSGSWPVGRSRRQRRLPNATHGPLVMQSTGAVRKAFLAAAIEANEMGQVPKLEPQTGYMAQSSSRRPDDAREKCQKEGKSVVLHAADRASVQSDSSLVVGQEAVVPVADRVDSIAELFSVAGQEMYQVESKSQSASRKLDGISLYSQEVSCKAVQQVQANSNSFRTQEGFQPDSNFGQDSAARVFLK